MSETITDYDLQEQERRLLAAVYEHPGHISLVESHDPVMISGGGHYLWQAMQKCKRDGELDTARVTSRITAGNDPESPDHGEAREILRDIKAGKILGPAESARFVPDTSPLERWAKDLRDRDVREGVAMTYGAAASRLHDSEEPTHEVVSQTTEQVQEALREGSGSSMKHISEYVPEALADVDDWSAGKTPDTLKTGFWTFDERIGGVPMGELTIMAAASGAGKTSFLLQLLRQVALIEQGQDDPRACVFFSIEMSAKQVLHRAASAWKGTDLRRLQRDGPAQEEMALKHNAAVHALGKLPIYVDEDPEPTLDQMRSRILQVKAEHEIALIGVDYDEKVGEENRYEEQRVASISKGLKKIAKNTGAACVALSQYNSGPADEMRPGGDSDLRYSRKKHHEAAMILHWFWPKYFVEKGEAEPYYFAEYDEAYDVYDAADFPDMGLMTCSKNRFGPVSQFKLDFQAKYTRFRDPNEPQNYSSRRFGAEAPADTAESPF